MSRRSLVALVVGLLVAGPLVLAGVAVWMGGDDGLRRAGALKQSYAAGKFALYSDAGAGAYLGPVQSFTGCRPHGNVADAAPGADQVIRKHVSAVAYDSCVVRVGLTAMDQTLYDWIGQALAHNASTKNLWLISSDFSGQVESGLHLLNARLDKVAFPQLDAGAKEPAYLTLTLNPSSLVEFDPCCGSFTPPAATTPAKASKQAQTSNFRFTINGSTLPTTRINKIGAFTFRQETVGAATTLHLGDLELQMAKVDAPAWRQWFNDFVIQGNNAAANEKTATLEILSANQTDVVASFGFSGVGIFAHPGDAESNSEKGARENFSLYVEEATFTLGTAPPPPPPPPATTPTKTSPPPTETKPPPPPAETEPTETVPERKALAAPESLKASPGRDGEVQLAWTAVEAAESYLVLATTKQGGEYAELARSEQPELVIGDLKPGVTYYFVVRAVTGDGESESDNSPEAESPAG